MVSSANLLTGYIYVLGITYVRAGPPTRISETMK